MTARQRTAGFALAVFLVALAYAVVATALGAPAGAAVTSPAATPSPTCTASPLTPVQCHTRIPLPSPSKLPTLSHSVAKPAASVGSVGAPLTVHRPAQAPVQQLAFTGPRWFPLTVIASTMLLAGGIASFAGRGRMRT